MTIFSLKGPELNKDTSKTGHAENLLEQQARLLDEADTPAFF